MNVLSLSVTEPGRELAARLPYPTRHGAPAEALAEHWAEVDAFVVVLAVGATVRLIAPRLADKARDPAVVCVDDTGRWVVVVCGGHAGGGNDLARQVAHQLGAQPVITTATDRAHLPALDTLAGFHAEGDVAGLTGAWLAGRPIELVADPAWPLPAAVERALAATVSGPAGGGPVAGRVVVTDARAPEGDSGPPTVHLQPPSLVLGLGTSTGATAEEARAAVSAVLEVAGLSGRAVAAVATIDRRATHRAVVDLAAALCAPVRAFDAAHLDAVAVPSPSDTVRAAVGTASVAEAAALSAAGPGARLVVAKTATTTVTVAVARRARATGHLTVVGLGPGDPGLRTPAAELAVRRAQVVVGFSAYVDQCADLLSAAHDVERYALGQELERARAALAHAAAGRSVAMVCSGDAGIYAMASPVFELADAERAAFGPVDISVVPGVTAGSAAAALLGAPLGHDHLVVSLSDLNTDWAVIERRLQAAADSDLVVVLYNARSARRTRQLERAREILLAAGRPAATPVGLVTDAARPTQRVRITTLGDLPVAQVTMTTCVIIGSSSTRRDGTAVYTPRGYRR